MHRETGDTNYLFFFFLLIIHFQKNEAEAEQLFTNIDQYTNIDFTVYIGLYSLYWYREKGEQQENMQ